MSQESTICSGCNLSIVNDVFDWHQARCVGLAKGKTRPLPEDEDDEDIENYEDHDEDWLPWEKNIDATRLYAHSYREEGKYGSHPGHDGFDDESEP